MILVLPAETNAIEIKWVLAFLFKSHLGIIHLGPGPRCHVEIRAIRSASVGGPVHDPFHQLKENQYIRTTE